MRTWFFALILLLFGLLSAPPAAASSAAPLQPVLRPVDSVTQTQKETWLLEAAASGNHALAWQIAGQSFAVQSDAAVYTVNGLNVDLAYRSDQNGASLLSILKRRAKFYRHHSAELHAHLTNPDRIVNLDRPVDPQNILLPGSVINQTTIAVGDASFVRVGEKLYRPEYRALHGVPQLVFHYDPQVTTSQSNSFATTTPTSQLVVTSREMTDAEYGAWRATPRSSFIELWEGE